MATAHPGDSSKAFASGENDEGDAKHNKEGWEHKPMDGRTTTIVGCNKTKAWRHTVGTGQAAAAV